MISLRFGTGLLAAAATLFSAGSYSAAQTLTPLYNFSSSTGSLPSGSLMQADDGNFYGVTQAGGAKNLGTVFQLTPAGVEKVIYSFTGSPDECPIGGLIENIDGLLYGVTSGCSTVPGTVFSISLSGAYKTVATFTSALGAQQPATALIAAADGTLYGATKFSASATAGGAIFKVSPSGQVSIVYNFNETGKSIQPSALVVASDGLLYGTTVNGGVNDAGMVFRVATDGSSFKVLHSFTGILGDGSPAGGLVEGAGGVLYGISSGATIALNSLYKVVVGTGAYNIIQQGLSLGTVSGLLMGTDGTLYGIAGGLGGLLPEVFKLTPAGNLTKLVDISVPLDLNVNLGVLALGLDGALYGLSSSGGVSGLGFAYKLSLDTPLTPPINISLSEPSITLGNTVDLIYQLQNGFSSTANTCSAHGSGISGAVPSSGSLSIIPQTVGSLVYSIICDGIEAGTVVLNVGKADSTTEVASGPGTLQTGQRATFVFQVNGNSYEPKPTGQVTVMSNGKQIAYASLSNGQATLYISTVGYAPATYPLTIDYSGDALYKASSTAYNLKVVIDNTTAKIMISGSVIAGKPVTVTASVRRDSGISGQPTGTFSFMYNGMVIGTAPVNNVGDGALTTSTSNIDAGSYPISVSYSGDAFDAASTSATETEVITKSSSATKLQSSSISITPGQTLTLTATVTRSVPNGTAAAGSATFYSGSTEIGTAPFSNGVARLTYSTTGVPAGTYSLTAVFAGDAISTGSTSNAVTVKVK